MTLTGKGRIAGIIGWPVAHSLSPLLHGYWLDELSIDGAMVPLAVRAEDFSRVIDGIRLAGFAGVNVTVPHKEAAFAIAHDCDAAALAAGAANLLVFGEDGKIFARNTDAGGLAASLREKCGALDGKAAVLLGAGGAARGAVLALDELGARTIHILNRDGGRAATLAKALAPQVRAKTISPRCAAASAGGFASPRRSAAHAANRSGDSAVTGSVIMACWSPQYSPHIPRDTPGFLASTHISFVCPGMTSVLPAICGSQKEWMTSALRSRTRTGSPIGRCTSFAVVKPASGCAASR